MRACPDSGISRLQVAGATLLLILGGAGCQTPPPQPATTKLEALIAHGQRTMEDLEQMSPQDVPEKWRSMTSTSTNDQYTIKEHYRGTAKVLEIRWRSEWVGAASNRFNGTIFDGKRRIGNIVGFADGSTGVMPLAQANPEYQLSTTIKPGGAAEVTVFGPEYMESIRLCGRDTHLMDDLEYMKAAVITEEVIVPSTEVFKDEIDRAKRNR